MAATHTTNLGLNKPDRQDYVSVVSDINDNMEKLDSVIGAVPSGSSLQGQIDTEKQNITQLSKDDLLQFENIPGTTQTISFDVNGNVQSVTHKNGSNVAIRTDVFTFTDSSITEVRTLNTGESLTIVTNLVTLVTTVTYAAS